MNPKIAGHDLSTFLNGHEFIKMIIASIVSIVVATIAVLEYMDQYLRVDHATETFVATSQLEWKLYNAQLNLIKIDLAYYNEIGAQNLTEEQKIHRDLLKNREGVLERE